MNVEEICIMTRIYDPAKIIFCLLLESTIEILDRQSDCNWTLSNDDTFSIYQFYRNMIKHPYS